MKKLEIYDYSNRKTYLLEVPEPLYQQILAIKDGDPRKRLPAKKPNKDKK